MLVIKVEQFNTSHNLAMTADTISKVSSCSYFHQEFGGNIDKDTSRIHYLAQPIIARYVRFHPVTWHRGIAMRAGILGRIHTGECGAGFTKPNSASPCGELIPE